MPIRGAIERYLRIPSKKAHRFVQFVASVTQLHRWTDVLPFECWPVPCGSLHPGTGSVKLYRWVGFAINISHIPQVYWIYICILITKIYNIYLDLRYIYYLHEKSELGKFILFRYNATLWMWVFVAFRVNFYHLGRIQGIYARANGST